MFVRRTSVRAQRGRACKAQRKARKAARSLSSDYESIADRSQTEHPSDPEGFTYQEETLVDSPTPQRTIHSYAAAPSPCPSPPLDHPLDVSAHSSRVPPSSVHGSSIIITPPQPLGPGSGHHISHPAITQRQMKRSIKTKKPADKRPRLEYILGNAKTEDEQSVSILTSAQPPHQQFRASTLVTSPPAPSAHPSRSPSPFPCYSSDPDLQAFLEGAQIPEDLQTCQINTQAIPETPTQPSAPDIASPAQYALSQASSASLGVYVPDQPRTQVDYHAQAGSDERHPSTAASATNRPTSNAPPSSSQNTHATRTRPATNEGPPSPPIPTRGARPQPTTQLGATPDVVDNLPSTRGSAGGRGVRTRARGCGPGRTRTGGGRGRDTAVWIREALRVMSPSERAVPRNLGVSREGTSLARASTSASMDDASHTQPPTTSQRTDNRPNRSPAASAPRATSSPLNATQPSHTSTATYSSGNSEFIHHAFVLTLCHNGGSVGAVFQECFEGFQPAFRPVVPRRVLNLTCEWFDCAMPYSNAAQPAEEQGPLPSQAAEFRADTPTLDEPNEPNLTLDEEIAYTEQIRELGLDEDMENLWANLWVGDQKWEQAPDDDGELEGSEDEEIVEGGPTEELVEHYDDGRISAHSKGKGRATH
ncbi:unnamed protein product [Rhizoctonia solani]|uniref:Uncharacterized protein n=1 Tax=Rhizoctonia solani TaxID=456999 RepID=A0A8H3E813_9AGAM|nr:unnamed protein product [Rhizoctonia solani]